MLGCNDAGRNHWRHCRFEKRHPDRQPAEAEELNIKKIDKQRRQQQFEPQTQNKVTQIPLEVAWMQLVTNGKQCQRSQCVAQTLEYRNKPRRIVKRNQHRRSHQGNKRRKKDNTFKNIPG